MRPFHFGCIVRAFAAALVICIGVHAESKANSSSAPLPKILDHYLQWGLFDSLFHASDAWLNRQNLEANPSDMAQARRLRGMSLFARHDTSRAREDFHHAACLDSKSRLDSFYVPPAMWRLQDSLNQAVESQRLPCFTGLASTSGTYPIQPANTSSSPIPTSTNPPLSAGSKPASASRSAWTGAGWVFGGLAVAAISVGAYQQGQYSQAYDQQAEAGRQGDLATYQRYGSDAKNHARTRDQAWAVALLGAGGSALSFYLGHRENARISLHTDFQGLEVACAF